MPPITKIDMPATPVDKNGHPVSTDNPHFGKHRSGQPLPDTAWKTPQQLEVDRRLKK